MLTLTGKLPVKANPGKQVYNIINNDASFLFSFSGYCTVHTHVG